MLEHLIHYLDRNRLQLTENLFFNQNLYEVTKWEGAQTDFSPPLTQDRDTRQLMWYGRVMRISEQEYFPETKQRNSRPNEACRHDIEEATKDRTMNQNNSVDRKRWRLKAGIIKTRALENIYKNFRSTMKIRKYLSLSLQIP